jgi:hypothetical protein
MSISLFFLFSCTVWALQVDISVAISPDVLEIAREFIATTQIDVLSDSFLPASHCLIQQSPPYVMYILYDSMHCSSCLNKLDDQWQDGCLPSPIAAFLVHTVAYSPPLSPLSTSKNHITALTHFLLRQQRDPALHPTHLGASPRRDTEPAGAGVVLVMDLSRHCLLLPLAPPSSLSSSSSSSPSSFSSSSFSSFSSSASLLSALQQAHLSTHTTDTHLLLPLSTPPSHSSSSATYITTQPFIDLVLLESMITTSTLFEYASDTDILEGRGEQSPYSLTRYWQQLMQQQQQQEVAALTEVFATEGNSG